MFVCSHIINLDGKPNKATNAFNTEELVYAERTPIPWRTFCHDHNQAQEEHSELSSKEPTQKTNCESLFNPHITTNHKNLQPKNITILNTLQQINTTLTYLHGRILGERCVTMSQLQRRDSKRPNIRSVQPNPIQTNKSE